MLDIITFNMEPSDYAPHPRASLPGVSASLSPIRIKNEASIDSSDYPMAARPGQQIQPRNRVIKVPQPRLPLVLRRNESKPLTNGHGLLSSNRDSHQSMRVPHPPQYGSRTLSKAESGYSYLDHNQDTPLTKGNMSPSPTYD